MAEYVFKKMVDDAGMADMFYIASAATSTEEIWNGIGNPVYPPAKAEMAKHGISCEEKRAVQITKADYNNYDLLIGMDNENIRNMRRLWNNDPDGKISLLMSYTGSSKSVADPWYTRDFGATWRDVNAGCRALLDYILQNML